jgi:predicted DNA-binding transcriptional regulator YafY
MAKKHFIKRYNLITSLLRNKPSTFEEIVKHIQEMTISDEGNSHFSIRTFQRDIKELSSHDIEITYNRSTKLYEISEENANDKTSRLLELFEIHDALQVSKSIQGSLILEKRKSLGTEHMNGLLHAINNKIEVTFDYTKHGDFTGIAKNKQVKPIALKEARNRWYLITKDVFRDKVKAYALDRIANLKITDKSFTKSITADLEELYKHSFGIITGEKEPQKIILEFSKFQANYIKSFPLHHSQEVVSENENYCTMEYFLSPTYDFVMELMSIGKEVKIIEPESLKEEIIQKLQANLSQYK